MKKRVDYYVDGVRALDLPGSDIEVMLGENAQALRDLAF